AAKALKPQIEPMKTRLSRKNKIQQCLSKAHEQYARVSREWFLLCGDNRRNLRKNSSSFGMTIIFLKPFGPCGHLLNGRSAERDVWVQPGG
ncbi:MAG: hypothetical protein ACK496_10045, partial [Acidobacteriota bacterium]